MTKRPTSREEAEGLVGRRTPRRGEGQSPGPNWAPRPQEKAPPKRMGNPADPLGLKKGLRDREAAAGLKNGGKVRKGKMR